MSSYIVYFFDGFVKAFDLCGALAIRPRTNRHRVYHEYRLRIMQNKGGLQADKMNIRADSVLVGMDFRRGIDKFAINYSSDHNGQTATETYTKR